jgi:hypothetical protein
MEENAFDDESSYLYSGSRIQWIYFYCHGGIIEIKILKNGAMLQLEF